MGSCTSWAKNTVCCFKPNNFLQVLVSDSHNVHTFICEFLLSSDSVAAVKQEYCYYSLIPQNIKKVSGIKKLCDEWMITEIKPWPW